MITIYHVPTGRSIRVIWLMEEMGEPYRLEVVPFPLTDAFRALTGTGTVPAIDDDGIRMGESIAILQYLTGRRLVAGNEAAIALTVGPRPDPAHYAEHLQWLHFAEADLTVPVGTIRRTRRIGKEQTNSTVELLLEQLDRRYGLLDRALAGGREWITGDRFTIADIAIGYAFHLASVTGLDVRFPDGVQAYWQRMQARPAFQRAIAR